MPVSEISSASLPPPTEKQVAQVAVGGGVERVRLERGAGHLRIIIDEMIQASPFHQNPTYSTHLTNVTNDYQ